MADYNAILEMIQPRKPSDYEAMARGMTHQTYNSPYGGMAENLAQGLYESPGQLIGMIEALAEYTTGKRSTRAASRFVDDWTGVNELGFDPSQYSGLPALQGIARLAGNIAGDPLNALPGAMIAGQGVRGLARNNPLAEAMLKKYLPQFQKEMAFNASDVSRVNFPELVPAPPQLTRPSTGRGGRIPGAPAHVKTPEDEMAIMNDYLAGAEGGVLGRDWYARAAVRMNRDTGNISGARPGAADQAAAVIGDFSPRATLEANRLAQVRAINQHATGRPVAAGMGPRNNAAQGILDEGLFSAEEALKIGPFSMQVRGLKAPRGVHDVRDINAWGFGDVQATGTANHRWMDKMTDDAVRLANERKIGGFDDWTHEKVQAARWVKHKADEQGVDVQSLVNEFGPADEWLNANVHHEAYPSQELLVGAMDDASKRAYTAGYAPNFTNPEGQNALAHQLGLLSPEQTRFVGEWEGATNPNIVTQVLADPGKGSDAISEWSDEAVNFYGSLEGLLGGQADVATSFLRRHKKVGNINSSRIPFDRAVEEKDLTTYASVIRKKMEEADVIGDVAVNFRNPKELEATWIPTGDFNAADTAKARKAFRKILGDVTNGKAIDAVNSGGLISWADEYTPSEWMKHLQNPKMRKAIEDILPIVASDIEKTVSKLPLTDKGKKVYLETVRLIKSGGLSAVERAIKADKLPVAILGAFLFSANQGSQRPTGEQGQI